MLALSQPQSQLQSQLPWTTAKTDDSSSWQNASHETEVQQSKQIHTAAEQCMGSANRAQHETRPKAFMKMKSHSRGICKCSRLKKK